MSAINVSKVLVSSFDKKAMNETVSVKDVNRVNYMYVDNLTWHLEIVNTPVEIEKVQQNNTLSGHLKVIKILIFNKARKLSL